MNKQEQYQVLWKERISDFENSGLSIRSWCEKNQIKIHQLQYWRRKFKKSNNEQLQLIPVNLDINRSGISDDSIKIKAGKLSLEIQTGFNPSLLKEVMKVLMEVC